ncbi:MAG: hypothetical protein LBD25_05965 [Coriobacteriales bacterium]|jgi:hypothetical protein|nr:hypothetical protein [Coriobacteriales bacterium]
MTGTRIVAVFAIAAVCLLGLQVARVLDRSIDTSEYLATQSFEHLSGHQGEFLQSQLPHRVNQSHTDLFDSAIESNIINDEHYEVEIKMHYKEVIDAKGNYLILLLNNNDWQTLDDFTVECATAKGQTILVTDARWVTFSGATLELPDEWLQDVTIRFSAAPQHVQPARTVLVGYVHDTLKLQLPFLPGIRHDVTSLNEYRF